MIIRIARLTAGEFLKLFAQPFFYISLAILFIAAIFAEVLLPGVHGQKETLWRAYNSVQLFAYGFKVGIYIATFVLLIFSSMMFAGEFDRGTIKNLLTRPITRGEFFTAKCVTVVSLAVLLYLFVLYVSLGYAFLRGQMGPVWDDSQFIMQRDYSEIVGHLRKAVAIGFLPFLAAGFLGILVSNLTETSGYAVAIALVVFLVGDIVSGMLSDGARHKVFLTYGPYAFEKLRLYAEGTNTRWNPDLDKSRMYVTVPLTYLAGFIPLAFALFKTRNISA